jgi:hypothetical protein
LLLARIFSDRSYRNRSGRVKKDHDRTSGFDTEPVLRSETFFDRQRRGDFFLNDVRVSGPGAAEHNPPSAIWDFEKFD